MIRDELRRALSVLGDRLPDGRVVVIVRRAFGDRAITFVRGDVEQVTGYPASLFEAPTETWAEIVHPADRESVLDRLRTLPGAEELRLEYRVHDPEGGVRWLRESLRVRRAAPEAPPEIVGVLADATFDRTIRAKVSSLEKELWRSRKLESVGTMATGVAHDFNNLLTVILASVDLLRGGEGVGESAMEDVAVIRDAATRGMDLVRQILTFAAQRPKRVETVDASVLVGSLEGILRRAVGDEIDLRVDVGDVWPLEVDRAHLEQILFNLTSNARDAHCGEKGSVHIQVSNLEVEERVDMERGRIRPGRYLRISVTDEGGGIDEGIRERLFEPFFSTKNDEEEDGTGGFGLPTVLRLVRGYGGAVDVESELGRGSAFHVYLPVRESGLDKPAPAKVRGGVPAPAAGKARILLVDDDPAVRDVVQRMLERDGHSVESAGSAEAGLQIFDRVRPPFDLLLTDVVLPDRSGYDLWRAAARRVADLPVLFMTGYDRETVVREGVLTQDLPVLEKPISPERLSSAVSRELRQSGHGVSRAVLELEEDGA